MAFLVSTIADVIISTESWGITQFLYLLTSLSFSSYQIPRLHFSSNPWD